VTRPGANGIGRALARDGQAFEVRGVTLFEIVNGQIVAGRLYLEDVERQVVGIEGAVEALSGRRPRGATALNRCRYICGEASYFC
jgi:hypothetical protein